MMNEDTQLLQEYAVQRSELAFETLVSRYADMVYSAALRHVRNAHLAEEITQTVFIILARKAGSLNPKTILPGWLYRTTRYASSAALKAQHRREHREQETYMQAKIFESENDAAWEQITPFLDDAMTQLRGKDHDAIVLRYFQNQSLRQVGASLGVDEHAAQKRVSRALDQLRKIFTKRGIALSAAAIAGAVSANSVQAAPATLVKSVTLVAAAKGGTAAGSTSTLIKGTLKFMTWSKLKFAAGTGAAALLLAAGTTTVLFERHLHAQSGPTISVSGGILKVVPPKSKEPLIDTTAVCIVAPDALVESLGIQWNPAQSGGMVGLLDPSQTNAVIQTLHGSGDAIIIGSLFTKSSNGKGAGMSRSSRVTVSGTNAYAGVSLNAKPTYSANDSHLDLDLKIEVHELVNAATGPDLQSADTIASIKQTPSQTAVIRQSIPPGQVMGKEIKESSSLLVFVTCKRGQKGGATIHSYE